MYILIIFFLIGTWLFPADYQLAIAKNAHDENPQFFTIQASAARSVRDIICRHKNSAYNNPYVVYLLQMKTSKMTNVAHWAETSEKCIASGALSFENATKIASYVPNINLALKQLEQKQ